MLTRGAAQPWPLVVLLASAACAGDTTDPVTDAPVGPTPTSDTVDSGTTPPVDTGEDCGAPVELFDVGDDDETARVAFGQGFTFDFYGTSYTEVWVNTNGGLTFGAGSIRIDAPADRVEPPGIGVFWGDMVLDEPAHIRTRQCPASFLVTFTELLDYDKLRRNTATTRLWADGTIEVSYGDVASADLLVGLWDGTHTDDRRAVLADRYPSYPASGTGLILYDYWAKKTDPHDGSLSGRTISFEP